MIMECINFLPDWKPNNSLFLVMRAPGMNVLNVPMVELGAVATGVPFQVLFSFRVPSLLYRNQRFRSRFIFSICSIGLFSDLLQNIFNFPSFRIYFCFGRRHLSFFISIFLI